MTEPDLPDPADVDPTVADTFDADPLDGADADPWPGTAPDGPTAAEELPPSFSSFDPLDEWTADTSDDPPIGTADGNGVSDADAGAHGDRPSAGASPGDESGPWDPPAPGDDEAGLPDDQPVGQPATAEADRDPVADDGSEPLEPGDPTEPESITTSVISVLGHADPAPYTVDTVASHEAWSGGAPLEPEATVWDVPLVAPDPGFINVSHLP